MRVLVTGCGGFLGAEIVQQLMNRGDEVIGISRSRYPELENAGMDHHQGDLRDRDFTLRAIRDCDVVVHTAAIAGVWGRWERFHSINTLATHHVVEACRNNGVDTLVFTSSPSVTFDGSDQCGIDESVGYSNRWLCHYPHTKALAEQAVLAANRPGGFHTCALRPHLIWGEHDPHLLARVLERARTGKLMIVGDGMNRVDTVHVVNAAYAHLCAIDALHKRSSEAAGRAFFIAQDEPVSCWEWISQICELGGVEPPERKISFRSAYAAGTMMEWAFRLTGRKKEPPMTRFVAAQLAKHHFFDISASRKYLGYEPILSMADGVQRLKESWRR